MFSIFDYYFDEILLEGEEGEISPYEADDTQKDDFLNSDGSLEGKDDVN